MKKLKLSLAATALTLALTLPTFAGDMPCGVTSTSPDQRATAEVSQTTALDPLTELALSLIQSALSLF